jgi:uncharacterized membrane protein
MPAIPETLRMPPRLRKSMLFIHIVTGVGWMGTDIALAILVFGALRSDDAERVAASYLATAYIGVAAVPVLALAMTVSGIILSIGSGLGLLKHWWVLVKLVISLALCVLVYVALLPELRTLPQMVEMGASADDVRDQLGPTTTGLLFPPVVSFTMMAVASLLSIFKPWGKTPWTASSRRRTTRATTHMQETSS